MDYLGFEVGQDGIRTSSEKVKAILDWPRPLSVHDVRSFLGLASYYRKFIRGFSQLAKPLTDLTREKIRLQCGKREEQSFLALKAAIVTAPVLCLLDFECCALCPGAIEWHNIGSVCNIWECGWDCFLNTLLTLCTI